MTGWDVVLTAAQAALGVLGCWLGYRIGYYHGRTDELAEQQERVARAFDDGRRRERVLSDLRLAFPPDLAARIVMAFEQNGQAVAVVMPERENCPECGSKAHHVDTDASRLTLDPPSCGCTYACEFGHEWLGVMRVEVADLP